MAFLLWWDRASGVRAVVRGVQGADLAGSGAGVVVAVGRAVAGAAGVADRSNRGISQQRVASSQ
jgi:hypothetical protein